MTFDRKIAETAFNKLLELNHRHSQRRFNTACFLLERTIGKAVKRDGLECIQNFAMSSQLKFYRQRRLNSSLGLSSDISQSIHRPFPDDSFTNVIGPGIVSKQTGAYHTAGAPSQIFSSNGDKIGAQTLNGSAVPFGQRQVSVMLNTTFSPSKLSSNKYDSHMKDYQVQMGFGAVPNHIEKTKPALAKKRTSSRSTSQKRYVNK